MGRQREKILLCIAALAVLAGPPAWLIFTAPSSRIIEEKRCVDAGRIRTANGSELEVHLVWGDVFRPRAVHRDMGYDIVCISCYFDPIVFENAHVLPGNPLLNSAVVESAQSEEELQYLRRNIFGSLEKSREIVAKFMNGGDASPAEGDQIVPSVWVAYHDSRMSTQHGVKYLAAVPLFNPDLLFGRVSEGEARERLALNVETVVRRVISYASDDLNPTVHSVAFAALGSTSHRGDDSRYFLDFSDGFLAILKGIEKSRPTDHLDRVYLVAYDRHQGVFKEDVLAGLQEVGRQVRLRSIVSSSAWKLIGGLLTIPYFLFCLLNYRNHRQIWRSSNRWTFVLTLLGFPAVAVGLSWFGALNAWETVGLRSTGFLWLYCVLSAACLVSILWIGKRFPKVAHRLPHDSS